MLQLQSWSEILGAPILTRILFIHHAHWLRRIWYIFRNKNLLSRASLLSVQCWLSPTILPNSAQYCVNTRKKRFLAIVFGQNCGFALRKTTLESLVQKNIQKYGRQIVFRIYYHQLIIKIKFIQKHFNIVTLLMFYWSL